MKSERIAWGASLGALLGYALAVFTSYPIRVLYDPHSDSWNTFDHPGRVPIRWYGWLINAALGALVGMLAMWPMRVRVSWTPIWILALAMLAVFGFHERQWWAH